MTVPPPGPPPLPPPPHGGYGGYGGGVGFAPPAPERTNWMAIASLVFAFLFFPLGIVFGHVSLAQLKRRDETGRGLAIAGLIISYVVAVLTVLAVIATVAFAALLVRVGDELGGGYGSSGSAGGTATPPAQQTVGELPPFVAPANLGANCQYPATTEPASKPVQPPRTGRVPTKPVAVRATIVTDSGPIGILLDNGTSPCTVNNFASLAQQGFFDGTPCHRLTTAETLGVLQCGDPTGSGTGGPGYQFPNEYPTNQFRLTDPTVDLPFTYPRGTLAMANAGPGTNGSQFFLVYADSQMPPAYTVFGSIDPAGLTVIDGIAAAGVQDGSDDGKPAKGVTIESVRLD